MPRARPEDSQAFLFDDSPAARALAVVGAAPAQPDVTRLGQQLSPSVYLGTSSWSFPGWRGLVFAEDAPAAELAGRGLAAYAAWPLHRTVGLDRAFYSPLTCAEGRALAALVPSGFRFLVKAHQSITRPFGDINGATFGDTARLAREGAANPTFLDSARASEMVVGPLIDGFREKLGPIVFQFPPLRMEERSDRSVEGLCRQLDRFFARLPVGPQYVLELRNREVLEPAQAPHLFRVLRDHRLAWGFAVHPTLPSIGTQAEIAARCGWPVSQQPILSIRWLLGHGLSYVAAREAFSPFRELLAPDHSTRSEVVELVREALRANIPASVILNNKAEGSAPLSLFELARALTNSGPTSVRRSR
jgi:uncharacterized protein YecE (DUF72 family)